MRLSIFEKNEKLLLRILFMLILAGGLSCICLLCSLASTIRYSFYITLPEAFIIFISLTGLSLFASRSIYFLIAFIASFCLVADIHLLSTYGTPFFLNWENYLSALFSTDVGEFFSYLPLLKFQEISASIFCIVGIILTLFTKPYKKIKLRYIIALSILFCLTYPLTFIVPVSKWIFQKQPRINAVSSETTFKITNFENLPQNVVLLIGESHRYDFFTDAFQPYQNKYDQLITFSNYYSPFGYTENNMISILTALNSEDINQKNKNSPLPPSLISLFKLAGYETFFINYELSTKSKTVINTFNQEADKGLVYHQETITKNDKEFLRYNDFRDWFRNQSNDLEIPRLLHNIFKDKNHRHFIVIKMIGVHMVQEDRYPKAWDIRKPSFQDKHNKSDLACRKNALSCYKGDTHHKLHINTYANAMDYSVYVIDKIIGQVALEKTPSFMLFTSDHGFCMFDAGVGYNSGNCQAGFKIPFIAFGNTAYINEHKNQWETLAKNSLIAASHDYLFSTILSLAGIDLQQKDIYLDLTTHTVKEKPQIVYVEQKGIMLEDLK